MWYHVHEFQGYNNKIKTIKFLRFGKTFFLNYVSFIKFHNCVRHLQGVYQIQIMIRKMRTGKNRRTNFKIQIIANGFSGGM